MATLTITEELEKAAVELPPDQIIFGTTWQMQEIKGELERLAATDLPILIEGESGTGKGVVARWIHAHSSRSQDRFVKVHCPAIPAMLLESLLFGYERGAFAGALRLKPGRIEIAGGGTLFLDEVSELDLDVQATLLHLLQNGRFTRIGGSDEQPLEARVICSSRRCLVDLSALGTFRKELLYRINAVHVRLPLLRDRVADLPALAEYMLEALGHQYGVPVRPFSTELLNLFQACPWPGNIQQLENLVRRYVVLGCEEECISLELLGESQPEPLREVPSKAPFRSAVRALVKERERKIILRTLYAHRWNCKETARALGISYRALLHKMRQDQLKPPRSEGRCSPAPTRSGMAS
ncbi:MAG: sigma 54-interacting transcriptional regulator [Terriglobia bacterium]